MRMIEAIGGYFELELAPQKNFLYQDAKHYHSARAAFLALLRSVKPKRVWMPRYICDSMLAPVHAAGIEICHYAIDKNFSVAQSIDLQKQDIFLYVNYFGICEKQVDYILEKFNPLQVVIDCSQAFYAKPKKCLATVYSPRKFFGLPDGGLLVTDHSVPVPQEQDKGSEKRMEHLIKRLGGTPEAGYDAFQQAEQSLNDLGPYSMSALTEQLLASVDVGAAKEARNRNFHYLRNALDDSNLLKIPDIVDGPMCYPYLTDKNISRSDFAKERIFMATYWTDALGRIDYNSVESQFINSCYPIPCDQRYDEVALHRILRLLQSN